MSNSRPGVVSVILVNFRGADDTIEAIGNLRTINFPQDRLEIIVVENGSGDDSAARISAAHPDVMLIESQTNDGFAGGCNRGASSASGEILGFLNNDARPGPEWVSAALERFEESPLIGGVASKVLDWDGKLVDYIGSAMTWYGMGYKPFTAEAEPKKYLVPEDVLFGTGSAMFVRRSVYQQLGGFDERFFMFFEDVDLGWRLNLLGFRFAYEPSSVAYHKHHASMKSFGSFKESFLLERNALFTLFKNAGEQTLREALPAAIALSIRRGVVRGDLDSSSFDLRIPGGDNDLTLEVSKQTVSAVFAIDQFTEALPELRVARELVQSTRRVSDAHIWRLFNGADAPVYQAEDYLRGYENLVTTFDVAYTPRAPRVLIITGDPIGKKLAGPAIRAWSMAEALSKDNDVKVVTLSGATASSGQFEILYVAPGDNRSFAPLEEWAEVIIFQGHAMAVFESLQTSEKILVVDIYDPLHLEQLEQGRDLPASEWNDQVSDATDILNQQLARGDFFLTASERQRMFWLGQLAAVGRINPSNYVGDPDLAGLIDVVPFGLSEISPVHTRPVLRGVVPGIAPGDKVLLWSGGLYNWFDPKTLIRAVALLAERRDSVRLFFQGTKHPHPGVPEMSIVSESRALADELGALDKTVFFNPSWVDFDDRQNYLLEADAGVSTHFSHIETTFSFRTRILDYLWAGLPMVVTDGDHFAEVIKAEGLGVVVDAGDVEALASALELVLFDEEFRIEAQANISRVREQYYWSETLKPLVEFVGQRRHARDNFAYDASGTANEGPARSRERPKGLKSDLKLVAHYLRSGGVTMVLGKVRSRVRRIAARS